MGGEIPYTKDLFLGDLVDRGYYSVETILLLLALKVKHPERLFLVRGNHESREITLKYGFYEDKRKYAGSLDVWQHCTRVFDVINLSAVTGGKVFCVHGGLSPSISATDELNEIKKGPLLSSGPASDLYSLVRSKGKQWVECKSKRLWFPLWTRHSQEIQP